MAVVGCEGIVAVRIKKNGRDDEYDEYPVNLSEVMQPIDGDSYGKHLLSTRQLSPEDFMDYIRDAEAAERIIRDPRKRGFNLLPFVVLTDVMRQPSTRTAGSMATAMEKAGGSAQVFSGMEASSESKGESIPDSWVALAAQSDIIGTRTKEEYGPALAAQSINEACAREGLWQVVPVINLGDGKNEHPTQDLGDKYTIYKKFGGFDGLTAAVVGAQGEYRAHHSFMLGAHILGIKVIAVESEASPVPQEIVDTLGSNLTRVGADELDDVMPEVDILYMGRRPDEYNDPDNPEEVERNRRLLEDYKKWTVDYGRLQKMRDTGILLHPRPRREELHPSVDEDHRAYDEIQMSNMIPMRMAIIARHMGHSILQSAARL
jgi:aspartate carbamoyltransferase catalytic subunit